MNGPIRARAHRPVGFRAKVVIRQETADWIVETADSSAALDQALRLRHEVFCAELQGRTLPDGIEKDALDDACDHLLIRDKRVDRLVGTYRLFSSHFFESFYSESEFHLSSLLRASDEPKLELGRACIHREHRDGAVIQMLWRGIALYLTATRARFLLGCSSVQGLDVATMSKVSAWVRSRGIVLDERHGVLPRREYRVANPAAYAFEVLSAASGTPDASPSRGGSAFATAHSSAHSSAHSLTPVAPAIPGLVLAYAAAGARFAVEPAFDADFECADFFTYLDLNDLNPLFRRRYFPREGGTPS